MEISPFLLVQLLLYSFLFGAAVGALNDAHRLIRVLFGVRYSGKRFDRLYELPLPFLRRPLGLWKDRKGRRIALNVIMFFQDILLFGFAGVGTAILNYYFNDGRFRFYTVVALVIGFLLYYFTVGKLVMLLSEAIIFGLRSFLTVVLFLISRPVVFFVVFFGNFVKKLHIKIEKTIANRRKKVYNISKVKCVMKEAEQGFLHELGLPMKTLDSLRKGSAT